MQFDRLVKTAAPTDPGQTIAHRLMPHLPPLLFKPLLKIAATLPAAAVLMFLVVTSHPGAVSAAECTADVYANLRLPAADGDARIDEACDISLAPTDVITKSIMISGAAASGMVLDCHGATLDGSALSVNKDKPMIAIRSVRNEQGNWNAPSDVTIRNCIVKGSMRLYSLSPKAVQASSFLSNHTEYAQATAPRDIRISGMTFVADGRVALYVGVGVTGMTLTHSTFTGYGGSTAIYLDAETASNVISGNIFKMTTRSREQIAVDGSAHNVIANNTFDDPFNGGIFLYRNCGERHVIRHQKPQYNRISDNIFRYTSILPAKPAVWLNSRNGTQHYCFNDPAYPFGSSLSSLDYAQFNQITGNRLIGGDASLIRNTDTSDDSNTITGNTFQ